MIRRALGYSSRMNDITVLPSYQSLDPREQGRLLFAQGVQITDIAKQLNVARSTVESWKQRDHWKRADIFDDVTMGLRARLLLLIGKDSKSNADYKEMDALMRQLERTAKIERYRKGGTEADLNPKIANRNKGERKKPLKNQITEEQYQKLKKAYEDSLFAYQRTWVKQAIHMSKVFMLLKSRQIGATYVFARWALIDLLETGHNKIFLSASKAQAYQFIEYIKAFVLETIELELTGDPIVINGPSGQATIYYMGTNHKTAQGRHGDVVMDEFMWINKFEVFDTAASAMASQKYYRNIYLSTPSSINHESYQMWSGKDHKKGQENDIDISHATLHKPTKCIDGRTRQIVTLTDAEAGGCEMFDRASLIDKFGDRFGNLFNCEFVDDVGSYFPMQLLLPNMIDSWEVWKDFKPFGKRRYDGPVWVGYDPSYTGDDAALAIIAPPQSQYQPYRILERHQFKNLPPHIQAQKIQKLIEGYNVEFFGIDNTGNGLAVSEHVANFYPSLTRINYNVENKTRMALRAKELFTRRRLHFDAGLQDVAKSFLSIKKALTGSGRQMTLVANRSAATGHADVAWAVMNALEAAPIADSTDQQIQGARKSRIKVFS